MHAFPISAGETCSLAVRPTSGRRHESSPTTSQTLHCDFTVTAETARLAASKLIHEPLGLLSRRDRLRDPVPCRHCGSGNGLPSQIDSHRRPCNVDGQAGTACPSRSSRRRCFGVRDGLLARFRSPRRSDLELRQVRRTVGIQRERHDHLGTHHGLHNARHERRELRPCSSFQRESDRKASRIPVCTAGERRLIEGSVDQ
jgi:hypothetical protein